MLTQAPDMRGKQGIEITGQPAPRFVAVLQPGLFEPDDF